MLGQSGSFLSRNVPMGKQFGSILRPALHLTGCICHGFKEYFFCSDEDLRKDPNTQVEVLMLVMTDVLKHCESNNVEFPKNIFIQADNCPREMRNQFTLLWGISLLLLCPFINSITFNFLRKGHTHEDIGTQYKIRLPQNHCCSMHATHVHPPCVNHSHVKHLESIRMHAHACIHAYPPADQIFGKIAGVLVKCLRLDTPLALMKAILKGLGLLRSRGRGLHVDRLEKSRNWEAWVAELEVAISGYTDPGSSHSTRLIRRKGDSDCKYMPYRVPHHPCAPIHSAPHTQARSKCMSASMHISC